MEIFADVGTFVLEHRGCGQFEGHAGEPGPYGYGVVVACACGARLTRWVTGRWPSAILRPPDWHS